MQQLRIQQIPTGRELRVEDMDVTYVPSTDLVYVTRQGRLQCTGRWDGSRFVQLSGRLNPSDQSSLSFALQIETQC